MKNRRSRVSYSVRTSYPAEHYPALDSLLYERLGTSHGSGMDIGSRNPHRDNSWDYKTLAQAQKARKKINRIRRLATCFVQKLTIDAEGEYHFEFVEGKE
jgi:hypothetical protein